MHKPLLALAAALLASPAFADTLVFNANGIQVDGYGHLSHFYGFVIGDDGKVARLVRADEPQPRTANRIDARGRTLLPGLIDAHGHFIQYGLQAIELDLTGSGSLVEMQQRLARYAAQNPGSGWIVGRGWNQELWSDKRFPTAADIDRAVSDRPVWLVRVDEHAAVGNSAALRAAGITAAVTEPAGGRIERDSAGQPTGLFVDNARALVESRMPPPDPAKLDRAFDAAQARLLAFGVTATGDMATEAAGWAAFRRAGESGRLKVRIVSFGNGIKTVRAVAGDHPTPWLYRDHLRMSGLKLFADGALGSRGAWLKQPYADMPGTRGTQRTSEADMLAAADQAAGSGFQVAIHAIGDAANAEAIGIYEKLGAKYGRDRRWRIEHFQIVDPADIPRLAPAGIIASMQPTHQTSDRLMAEKRLGPNRLAGAYAWHSVLQSGAKLAFGSDFPVESPNPFPGLAAAVSRQDMKGEPPGGWIPSERLSFEQALDAFTRGAAYAGFAEAKIGSLAPGKWADFIIIDRDAAKVDAQDLARTQVLETWIAGKKVYDRPHSDSTEHSERGK